jgi:predicted dehydrogenase
MTPRPIGIAVIGAGVVGRMRAATVARCPDTTLVLVADVDEGRARAAVQGTGAVAATDYRRALDLPEVDALIVSTPAHLHEPVVVAALEAGRHVLCEKPLGIDVSTCRRMVDQAAASRRTLAVGFNHRYFPCVKDLKASVDSGRLGAIDHVRALAGHPGLHEFRADWMYKREMSGGGAMMDIGIHMTDLVRFVAGEIVEVTGISSNRVWSVPGSEDNALALMKTASGIPVRYQATWSEWKGYRLALEVYGARGMAGAYYAPMMNMTVTTDESRRRRTRRLNLHPWVNVREKLRGWQTTATLAFADELADFLGAIAGRQTRIADGYAGLRAVAIAHAVEASSAAGAPVRVID